MKALRALRALRLLLSMRAWLRDPTLQGSAAAVALGGAQAATAWQNACEQVGQLIPAEALGLASMLVGASIIVARALTQKPLEAKAQKPES